MTTPWAITFRHSVAPLDAVKPPRFARPPSGLSGLTAPRWRQKPAIT